MSLEDKLSKDLAHELLTIKNAASEIWKIPKHIHFTNHNIDHSENIIIILNDILKDMSVMKNPLTEHEIFILLASAYLHDIGMQSAIHAGLDKKDHYAEDDLMIIREKHHDTVAKMIYESINPKAVDRINCGLNNGVTPDYAPIISIISKSHRKGKPDINDPSLNNDYIKSGIEIRCRLLVSLLRLADELDRDFTRINMNELKTWTLPTSNKIYWWIHHYTKAVTIKNGIIKVLFRIPKQYKDTDIDKIIFKETNESIKEQLNEVHSILYNEGIQLHFEENQIDNNNNYDENPNIEPIHEDLIIFIKEKYSFKSAEFKLKEKTGLNYYFDGIINSENTEFKKLMFAIIKFILEENNKQVINLIVQALINYLDPEIRISLLLTLGNTLHKIGNYPQALIQYNNVLTIIHYKFPNPNDEYYLMKASILGNISIVYTSIGKFKEALDLIDEAKRLYNKICYERGIADCLSGMGIIHKNTGAYEKALKCYKDAIEIYKSMGNKFTEACVLNNIGIVNFHKGDYTLALKNYNDSFILCKGNSEVGAKQLIADLNTNIGNIYRKQKKFTEAKKCYIIALKMHQDLGDKKGEASDLGNIGIIHEEKNEFYEALDSHNKALIIDKSIGYKVGEAYDLGNMGIIYKKRKKFKHAYMYLKDCLFLYDKHDIKIDRDNYQKAFNSVKEIYNE